MESRNTQTNDDTKNAAKIVIFGSVAVVIVAIIVVGLLIMMPKGNITETPAPENSQNEANADCFDQTSQAAVTLTYNANEEFAPSCLKVKSGTKITYKNDSQAQLDVGADPHPTHTGNREVSKGEFDLSVAPGESASTTVTKKGTFGLHNHVNASKTATITVE